MLTPKQKPLSKKKCRNCGGWYRPAKPLQTACSWECAVIVGREIEAKKACRAVRDHIRARKEKLKTRGDYLSDCQTVFNQLVRQRDKDDGCISCDKPATWHGQWHSGHYKSVGSSPSLRFDLANVHKQCSVDNNYLSGNLAHYRPRLIAKIGQAEVDRLEGPQPVEKWTIPEIQAMTAEFKRLLKEAKAKE